MNHLMQADIHRAVTAALAELGQPHADLSCLNLRVLVQDGYYAGHTIQCEDIRVFLPANGSLIEFCGKDGTLLKTVDLNQGVREARNAA